MDTHEGLKRELLAILGPTPKIDIHTHLSADRLMARGLDDILLYHMVNTELYAAGAPFGERVPEDRGEAEAARRVEAAVPFLPKIRNTALSWALRRILADLYDWHEEITPVNWRALDARIKAANADDGGRARAILARLGIRKAGTELIRRADGRCDDLFEYALEWAFFSRTQWGQPDIALFELERAWNATAPEATVPVTMRREDRPALARTIRSADDIRQAVRHYCSLIPFARIRAVAQHISTDIDFGRWEDREVTAAIRRRDQAGRNDQNVYSSAITRAYLAEYERTAGNVVFQFSLGAEPLPFESGSRMRQETIGQVAELIAGHPGIRFMCFNASRHGHHALCTLVRELPNFSLGGFWWHSFFPGCLRQLVEERLDMVPLNRQCDFLTDAYCVDWVYGKTKLLLAQVADVFAGKIASGQYTIADGEAIAHGIFFDSARELLAFRAPA